MIFSPSLSQNATNVPTVNSTAFLTSLSRFSTIYNNLMSGENKTLWTEDYTWFREFDWLKIWMNLDGSGHDNSTVHDPTQAMVNQIVTA